MSSPCSLQPGKTHGKQISKKRPEEKKRPRSARKTSAMHTILSPQPGLSEIPSLLFQGAFLEGRARSGLMDMSSGWNPCQSPHGTHKAVFLLLPWPSWCFWRSAKVTPHRKYHLLRESDP